jgi:lipopolysaccharide/colanic/teichoic acid biosynthesis glycosyltransferase
VSAFLYQRYAKRPLDLLLAGAGLVVLSPLLAIVALAVRIDSPGTVLFRQQRVGRGLQPFAILKFRTMVANVSEDALPLTVAGDQRITRIGRFLRRSKLDELPQLWNILRGDMAFVGPRPEVGIYVDGVYSATDKQEIFALRPGLTDPAAVTLLLEEQLLAEQRDAENYYVRVLLPAKIRAYRRYAAAVTLLGDFEILLATFTGVAAMLLGRAGRRRPGSVATPGPAAAVRLRERRR